jgi:hypothetical protein
MGITHQPLFSQRPPLLNDLRLLKHPCREIAGERPHINGGIAGSGKCYYYGNCRNPKDDSDDGRDADPAGRFTEPDERDDPEQNSNDSKDTGINNPRQDTEDQADETRPVQSALRCQGRCRRRGCSRDRGLGGRNCGSRGRLSCRIGYRYLGRLGCRLSPCQGFPAVPAELVGIGILGPALTAEHILPPHLHVFYRHSGFRSALWQGIPPASCCPGRSCNCSWCVPPACQPRKTGLLAHLTHKHPADF